MGITNSSGTEIISYTYDAWGNATMYGSGVSNPWQYAGGYADATGLLKFGERYYDPGLGRWTQQDPIGGSLFDPSTGNRYSYANDDPVTLTDPHGTDIPKVALCQNEKIGATIGFIGAVALAIVALASLPEDLPVALGILAVIGTGATVTGGIIAISSQIELQCS